MSSSMVKLDHKATLSFFPLHSRRMSECPLRPKAKRLPGEAILVASAKNYAPSQTLWLTPFPLPGAL